MNLDLKKPIESLIQGLAYWIAYTLENNTIRFTEAEAVGEMAKILQTKIPFPFKVCREVAYNTVCPSIKSKQRADLGIFIEEKCKCLIEVKLNENTNGGYKKDICKLTKIKQIDNDIDCYVILLYRNFCSIDEPKNFVSTDGKALKRTIYDTIDNIKCKLRVRRVANALCSPTARKMKRVVWFEIL